MPRLRAFPGRVVHPHGIEPEPQKRRTLSVRWYDAVASPSAFARLNRHLARRPFRVPIAASYPLAAAAPAHRRLDRGRVLGRIILRVQ